MRKSYYLLLILLICSLRVMSQELVGKISDNDSTNTVLYPAEIVQTQGDKVIGTYKTFFDGTYRVKVKPMQTYQLKASFPGRNDTTVTISTDKFGTLASGSLFIKLHKNGLRLMGYILDRDEDLPIKDAGIIIRNVMTRKEEKYFTDVNGYYNLKMDFETNYSFKIDKRSPGIMNKFQDTSFNISTIGFNQALDFRFDIKLGPAEGYTKARPQYDPYAKPENKNLKPVVEVIGKKDSVRQREQAAALAELDKKLNSKDSAIASIDKKLSDINTAKQDEKTAKKSDEELKKEAARLKAEHNMQLAEEEDARVHKEKEDELNAKQLAEADAKKKEKQDAEALKAKQIATAKKKEKDDADAALKAKQLAEAQKKQQAEEAAALRAKQIADAKKKEKDDADAALKAKQLAEAQKKQQAEAETALKAKQIADAKIQEQLEEADQKAKQDADKDSKQKEHLAKLKEEVEREELVRIEAERKAKLSTDQKKKQEDDKLAKKQADKQQKATTEQLRITREEQAIARADSALLAAKLKKQQKPGYVPEKEVVKTEPKKEAKPLNNADREAAAIARADSALLVAKLKKEAQAAAKPATDQKSNAKVTYTVVSADTIRTDKQRRQQRDADVAKMKVAREIAEAKMLAEKREAEEKEKAAKKESKRLTKELAEQEKQHKRDAEQSAKLAEAKARIDQKKSQGELEQRDLEARRAMAEQEKKNLISQREKILSEQQVRVTKTDREPADNSAQKVSETNQKNTIADWEKRKKDEARKRMDTAGVVMLNGSKTSGAKVVKTKGIVKNGQTEDVLANVSINIRRLNGIVSQEVTSDSIGRYEFQVDSGYYYLVSYYKDQFEISKQILDLTSYKKADYTMLIQYLKEHDEFDPAAKMPVVQFTKNSSKIPAGLWQELEPIVKMMLQVPQLKMKLYGLGSADEDYPMELSITRARLVADMMMESGIKPSRIRINGIGSLRPRSGCVDGKECTQQQYNQDRVVMYKVVKE